MFLNFENVGNYPTYYSMAFFGSKFTSLCADNRASIMSKPKFIMSF
jgi:hypothetical protein